VVIDYSILCESASRIMYNIAARYITNGRMNGARNSFLVLMKAVPGIHWPGNCSLYLSTRGRILPRMKHWGLTDRRFHGRSQTECQHGSSGLFTCKARTVARATEPAFRKAGHDRRLP
jgi:hypothetical protein